MLLPTQALSTSWSDDGGGNVIYLDRHNIDCGNNAAISQFRVETSNNQVNQGTDTCTPSHAHPHIYCTHHTYCINEPNQKGLFASQTTIVNIHHVHHNHCCRSSTTIRAKDRLWRVCLIVKICRQHPTIIIMAI